MTHLNFCNSQVFHVVVAVKLSREMLACHQVQFAYIVVKESRDGKSIIFIGRLILHSDWLPVTAVRKESRDQEKSRDSQVTDFS